MGRHVHLGFGTVGSSQFYDENDEPISQSELLRIYGPFLGLPIIARQKDFEESRLAIRMTAQAERDFPEVLTVGYSAAEVARRILAAVDLGEMVTKATAEALFAGPMSHGQFMQAWRKVTESRPDLAKGGRRLGT